MNNRVHAGSSFDVSGHPAFSTALLPLALGLALSAMGCGGSAPGCSSAMCTDQPSKTFLICSTGSDTVLSEQFGAQTCDFDQSNQSSSASVACKAQIAAWCAGGSGGGAAGGSGGGNTINGRALQYFLNNGATTTVIPDLSNTPIRAISNSFFYEGVGNADGGFSIPHAPSGELYVSVGGSAYAGVNGGPLDFSVDELGRANVVRPTAGTGLVLQSSRMSAWHTGDDIEFVSAGAGLTYGDLAGFGYATPIAGATTLDAGVDYHAILTAVSPAPEGGLVDSTKGDALYVTHLVSQPVSGSITAASVVAEAFVSTNLTMVQGSSGNVVNQVFTDAGTQQHINVDYPNSAFASVRPLGSTVAGDLIYVDALLQGSTNGGFFSGDPDLMVVSLSPSASDVPVQYSWINPFPSSWPLVVEAQETVVATYTQLGRSATQDVSTMLLAEAEFDGTTAPVLAPSVGAVSSLRINAQNLTASTPNVGLTPTLYWTPPQTGTATSYGVNIMQLFRGSYPYSVGYFTVPGTQTSLQIPQGILEENGEYVAVIAAISQPGYSAATPLLGALPYSSIPVMSPLFAPATGVVIGSTSSAGWPTVPNQANGPVIASPNLVTITFDNDSNATVLDQYGTWITTGGYLPAAAGEYGIGNGTAQSVHVSSSTYPAPINTGSNANAFPEYLQSLLNAGVLPAFATNNVYALVLPANWADTSTFCQTFGGYHTNFTDHFGNLVGYAIIPDCASLYGGTVLQQQQSVEVVISHELVEAATDPRTGTYQLQDPQNPWTYEGGEVGDLCATLGTYYSSGNYVAQLIWSNQAVQANNPPCQPWNSANTYYSLVGPATMATGTPGSQVHITVTGWSSKTSSQSLGVWVQDADAADFATQPSLNTSVVAPNGTVTVTLTIPPTAVPGQHGAALVSMNNMGSTMVGVTVQ